MKRKMRIRFLGLILFSAALSALAGPEGKSPAAIEPCANPVFNKVLSSLMGTRVPVRLPSVLGEGYDAALYAEAGRISRSRYVIRIGQYCEHSYCPWGIVSGTKISGRANRPQGQVVALYGGVTGYVRDGSKNLKNSRITWDEGQYRYAIEIYGAEPAAIIKVANSALSCDNR